MGTGDYSVGTWEQSVTVGTWGRGQSGVQLLAVRGYMKAGPGVQYMYMGQGVQLLTVGRWAGCPADSGYIREGGSS